MELGPGKVISEHAWNNELGFCAWTRPLGRPSLSQAKAEGVIAGLTAGSLGFLTCGTKEGAKWQVSSPN